MPVLVGQPATRAVQVPALAIVTPGGSPVAVKVTAWPAAESADFTRKSAGLPSAADRLAGWVNVIVPCTSQVKLTDAVALETGSVAVTVPRLLPVAVGVPLISPVLASMARPAGSPVAE